MNSPKISLILPVFNVEKYIARALDSCVNQTFSDIEILVIDDCGSDGSIEIAKSYAARDSRIKIIAQPRNMGTFNARLKGIENASGEFLTFLDPDDFLALNALEVAYHAALAAGETQAGGGAWGEDLDSLDSTGAFGRDSRRDSKQDSPPKAPPLLDSRPLDSHAIAKSNAIILRPQDSWDSLDSQRPKNPQNSQISPDSPPTMHPANPPDSPLSHPQHQDSSLPDIVFFGMEFCPRTFKRVAPKVITKPLHGGEILKAIFIDCATPPWHLWAKIYKSSHIRNAINLMALMGDFPRLNMAEDVLKTYVIAATAQKSIGLNAPLYFYCDNQASITRKTDLAATKKKISDFHLVASYIERLSNLPQIAANPYTAAANLKTQNILKSQIELEHRYLSKEDYEAMRGGAA